MEQLDVVVVGAGVVGLAVARALALDGRSVWVLERAAGIGMGVSSRSSEVIHAGLYYPEGSHKARLCVSGKALLYSYLAQRGVPHQRCGKLLVAGAAERDSLPLWQAKAAANGVHDLQPLSRAEALALEPALDCAGALWSPSTGIVDSHALMLSLQGDLERAGGQVVTRCPVDGLAPAPGGGMRLRCADGTELWARTVVNAAGLQAPALARASGALAEGLVPATFFAKGRYFSLSGRSPFRRLIYPLPGPGLAGLGVHLTLDLAGQARFGPDVVWVDSDHDFSVDPAAAVAFESAIRSYWPGLPVGALQPSYAGIRPKLSGPGQPAADFVLQGPAEHGVPGWLNLFGIESPGLTSCLALGEWARTALAD